MQIRTLFFIVGLMLSLQLAGQNQPIGFWRAHMPYSNAIGMVSDGITLFAISDESFYSYNLASKELKGYSKVDGMSDVHMSCIGYDPVTDYVILVYKNTNIDLFMHETFYNIPDIKLKSMNWVKEVYDVYTHKGMAYLSTSFGIVVINLEKREIKETYSFTHNNQPLAVRRFIHALGYFYALTDIGLFRIKENAANLQDFAAWEQLNSRSQYSGAVVKGDSVYISTEDSVFVLRNKNLHFLFASNNAITGLDTVKEGIVINEKNDVTYRGRLRIMNINGQIVDTFFVAGKPVKTIRIQDDMWVADAYNGILSAQKTLSESFIKPNGPNHYATFDIIPYNGDVWVAHGSIDENWTYLYNQKGISHLKNGYWEIYDRRNIPALDTAHDYIVIAKDPIDGTLYAGSFYSGMLVIKPDGSHEVYKENSFLGNAPPDAKSYRVGGLVFDEQGVLWIIQGNTRYGLIAKTRDGQYHKMTGPGSLLISGYATIDDYNQKWYILPKMGVAVYNDNHTVENPNDDTYTRITISQNLPSNNPYCVVKDKEGAIWIGTDDGIGIVNCPGDMIQGNCAVERRIVQYDQFAGYLFQGERVKTIAVDGANRKWIGTMNGVWLISADGHTILERFTTENSPLPTNEIQKIAVDPVTGDVYFGTYAGLVSYRGTAVEPSEAGSEIVTFPNPVPHGYNGMIAIKGVPENADVRITDINGQLVYRTKAHGGQAVWNGLDYTGRRPQSGVYLIFASGSLGEQTRTGKMVFLE